MPISVFDLFKIGVGPSSSHTVGPMQAAFKYVNALRENNLLNDVEHLEVHLYGSLSATGVGHATDHAIIMGLMGERPDTIDPALIDPSIKSLKESRRLNLGRQKEVTFTWDSDIYFHEECLPHHPNAMRLAAFTPQRELLYENTYYSVGGGFVVEQAQVDMPLDDLDGAIIPYNFDTADELLALCKKEQLSVSRLMLENEKVWRTEEEVRNELWRIWQVMCECIDNGLAHEGVLPGGLNVKRRAKLLHQRLFPLRR